MSSVPMVNQCSGCAALRERLAEVEAQFDTSWRELLAERDALRVSIEAFQQRADRRGYWNAWLQAIGGGDPRPAQRHLELRWRAWLPWLIAAALFGVGLWWWLR